MMEFSATAGIAASVLLALLVTSLIEQLNANGPVVCYRRLKKPNLCGGHLKKELYLDFESCCAGKGQGFADRKLKVGKNRFKCTSCSELFPKTGAPRDFEGITLPGVVTTTFMATSTPSSTEHSTSTDFFWPVPARREYQVGPELPPPKDDNGQLIVWESWSPCSVTCGAGWRSRAKVCDNCDHNDYENVQSQPCMVNFYCPVDGNWGPWYPWGSCTTTCNAGIRSRQRKCNYPPPAYGGMTCEGEGLAEQECNTRPCPVDGSWSEWSDFSECSTSCGPGVSKRVRTCDSPLPQFGGKNCIGPDINTKKCEIIKCPVDGGWSLWNSWSWCTATCGRGVRERSRTCGSPKPQHGGKECDGPLLEQDVCYGDRPCPIDGGWSEWTKYGYCRAARCSKGHQIRSRSCSNPSPAHGGKSCLGQQYERTSCFNDQDCPRNGSWCAWSEWNSCSSTCKQDSLQGRHRMCTCPAPKNGGLNCQGDSLQVRRCEALPNCNISGKVLHDEVHDYKLSEVSGDGATYDEELEVAGDSLSSPGDTTTNLSGQANRNETKAKVDMGRNETSETIS
ncbi:unnamed protein product [Lymnaea stagnalis]|uniref:Hemicentin-1 n=1 Tax=Lymnaea stagnalis TaxID=6523 RepID=A0AAV2ILF8_LYMST